MSFNSLCLFLTSFYFGSVTKLKKKSELAKEFRDNSQTAEHI